MSKAPEQYTSFSSTAPYLQWVEVHRIGLLAHFMKVGHDTRRDDLRQEAWALLKPKLPGARSTRFHGFPPHVLQLLKASLCAPTGVPSGEVGEASGTLEDLGSAARTALVDLGAEEEDHSRPRGDN